MNSFTDRGISAHAGVADVVFTARTTLALIALAPALVTCPTFPFLPFLLLTTEGAPPSLLVSWHCREGVRVGTDSGLLLQIYQIFRAIGENLFSVY